MKQEAIVKVGATGTSDSNAEGSSVSKAGNADTTAKAF